MKVKKAEYATQSEYARYAQYLQTPCGERSICANYFFLIKEDVEAHHEALIESQCIINDLKKKVALLEEYLNIVLEKPEYKEQYVKKDQK